jgi:hypothetical protein
MEEENNTVDLVQDSSYGQNSNLYYFEFFLKNKVLLGRLVTRVIHPCLYILSEKFEFQF